MGCELQTKRLILRQFVEADVPALAKMYSDPQVMQYVGRGQTFDVDETWARVAFHLGHWQLRGYGQWAMVEKSSQLLLGRVGLHHPHGWLGLEVGWLVGREYWGQGFAPEGARASIEFAFDHLGENRLISCMRPENHASIRVAEKLGMHFDREATLLDQPALVYALNRSEEPT